MQTGRQASVQTSKQAVMQPGSLGGGPKSLLACVLTKIMESPERRVISEADERPQVLLKACLLPGACCLGPRLNDSTATAHGSSGVFFPLMRAARG